jgi:mRNA interferase MazF
VIPITRTDRKVRWHVAVSPPEGGLVGDSFAQCENVRSVSKQRLKRLRGRVSEDIMEQVEDRLRILLGL